MKECKTTSQASKFKLQRGFGLLEVVAAAVVLAFMLIGLNTLQKGNRESILRVRARDNANVIAQDIIDSLSAIGSASVLANCYSSNPDKAPSSPCEEDLGLQRKRSFEGEVGNIPMLYDVTVDVRNEEDDDNNPNPRIASYKTELTENQTGTEKIILKHQIAKHVDVTVNWKFKNSDQSIVVSSLLK